jgi:hypothetical protein
MRPEIAPKRECIHQGETKLVRLLLLVQRLEGEGYGLGVFRGNSSTFVAACLLWTQVSEV